MFLDTTIGNITEPVSGRQWGRQTILAQIDARSRRYHHEGIRAGDRVFLHFGNRLEFFADLLAIWRLGACAIPVDSRLTTFEVDKLIRVATPRVALVDEHVDSPVTQCLSASNVKVLNTTEIALHEGSKADGMFSGNHPRLDDEALILFTSGSTGQPKGVVHTHRSLLARWITLQQSLGLRPHRRTLCMLPTHFGHGLICNCLFPWLSGQDLFITPPFSTELITQLGALIDEHKITFLSSVPSIWRLALKLARPPSQNTLERVHCGSAPLSAYLWRDVQAWASVRDVYNAYGITETGSWVAGTTGADFVPEDGLIGRGWGAVIKILHTPSPHAPFARDMECKPNESGYVWINTPALMKEYLHREDLTNQVVCQGWFMTGDIGILDETGRLYLKGRERDEINKGGMKVYPADVEAVVEQFSQTDDVCVFGFDDLLYGQDIGMGVVLKDGSPATVGALYHWMKTRLAGHKMPKRWYLMDAIPRTSRGKVNRTNVMERCAELEAVDLQKLLDQA
ncbi:MAG TPA: class I adenylate-forming enzyme family protein [Burkholderiales bacterium]|nr:class I adenylate-forming enzyme family protein [Burkholderiales bacterium]